MASKKQELNELHSNNHDKIIKLKYLLENAIYKNDSERETFVLVELGIEIINKIENNCEKIDKLINN